MKQAGAFALRTGSFRGVIIGAVRWTPAAACAALIFFLSHQSELPGSDLGPDYVAHFLAYAVFATTLVWGATDRFSQSLTTRAAVWVVVAALLYGISDEFHQSFVPGRTPDAIDLVMDLLGAVAATAVLRVALRFGVR